MQGRFTSPDEFKGGPDELFDFEADASDNPTFYADLTNPQSLNKYQYGYNNPYKFNDPTGHWPPISSCLDKAQEVADYVGLVPKIGDIVDLANAGVSLMRGDTEAAGRRAIGAIPFVGMPIALGMKGAKVVKLVNKAEDAVSGTTKGSAASKTYQTYTKPNSKSGKLYRGKTSGKGTPQQNIARRERKHHKNKDGYGPAKLDKSSKNPDAIRGREQQLIDKDKQAGRSGNQRNSISPRNKNREKYLKAARKEFGNP